MSYQCYGCLEIQSTHSRPFRFTRGQTPPSSVELKILREINHKPTEEMRSPADRKPPKKRDFCMACISKLNLHSQQKQQAQVRFRRSQEKVIFH